MIENPASRKIFRRKRRFQGASWTPGTVSADVESGVWCGMHKIRHGYKSSQLGCDYEKDTEGRWKILWYCKETGNVLKEDILKGTSDE